MRRITRALGVIGGIGAVVWAMRERLISVAIPREPEPPAFRVPEADSAEAEPSPSPTVTDVPGIGPVYATRLGEIGVNSVADLAGSRAEKVASAAQVPLARAQGWIDMARSLHEHA